MKTAISIPDPLFESAEKFASSMSLSRNKLYTLALEEYLQTHLTYIRYLVCIKNQPGLYSFLSAKSMIFLY